MRITDRPGRYFAVLVFAPALLVVARHVRDTHPVDAVLLRLMGTILFFYECFWIARSDAEIVPRRV